MVTLHLQEIHSYHNMIKTLSFHLPAHSELTDSVAESVDVAHCI